jgi:hypothetical protein
MTETTLNCSVKSTWTSEEITDIWESGLQLLNLCTHTVTIFFVLISSPTDELSLFQIRSCQLTNRAAALHHQTSVFTTTQHNKTKQYGNLGRVKKAPHVLFLFPSDDNMLFYFVTCLPFAQTQTTRCFWTDQSIACCCITAYKKCVEICNIFFFKLNIANNKSKQPFSASWHVSSQWSYFSHCFTSVV